MNGKIVARIVSMKRDEAAVSIELEATGTVIEADGKVGPDAKNLTGKMTLQVKPVVGDRLNFGQKLYVNWTTEEQPL